MDGKRAPQCPSHKTSQSSPYGLTFGGRVLNFGPGYTSVWTDDFSLGAGKVGSAYSEFPCASGCVRRFTAPANS